MLVGIGQKIGKAELLADGRIRNLFTQFPKFLPGARVIILPKQLHGFFNFKITKHSIGVVDKIECFRAREGLTEINQVLF